jgi:hypothetical protein
MYWTMVVQWPGQVSVIVPVGGQNMTRVQRKAQVLEAGAVGLAARASSNPDVRPWRKLLTH